MQLEQELEFVRKSAQVVTAPASEKFAFIKARVGLFSIEFMCRCLDVSRSGYYNWQKRGVSEHQRRDIELGELVKEVFDESHGRYGAPRIHAELVARQIKVSRKRVARLMRELGLRANLPKKFVRTTLSDHDRGIAPDLLKRQFTVDGTNQVWISDITYIWTGEGWLYLATVIDLFARRVVGWSAADHMRDELVLNAVLDAFERRANSSGFEGLVFHSDRGSQYASNRFIETLEARGIRRSMSPPADCWSNGVAESFFATLKKELIYREDYPTRAAATTSIEDYTERFYNPTRRHSTNEYLSPIARESIG